MEAKARRRAGAHAGQAGRPRSAEPGDLGRLGALFADQLAREQDRWFLWLPVAMAAGVVVYFALPGEPSLAAVTGLAAAFLLAAWRLRATFIALLVAGLLSAVAGGMLAAKLGTERVTAPILGAELRFARINGWIEAVEERRAGRVRLLVKVHEIERIDPAHTPHRIFVTLRDRGAVAGFVIGDAVRLAANIDRPPGPVSPGGYDFAREAFFRGVGAVGFSFMPVERWQEAPRAPVLLRAVGAIDRLRQDLTQRIRAVLPGDTGTIATALTTGIRGGISDGALDALRIAGLAHILAISGMHMSLMAGTLFLLTRMLLALSPTLALTMPIKKIAAVVALAGAAAYLALSGAGIATQRAFVMMAVMFAAILLDRPALSIRNVALAAVIVIIVKPDSVLSPSFQMSFAAAAALIAAYEARRDLHVPQAGGADGTRPGLAARLAGRMRLYLAAVMFTSIVAELATAPFGAYHFNRVAPYSLAGNVIALPVFGTLVMPFALIGLLAVPFGLERYPLWIMGQGIEWVLYAGRMVAGWPAAEIRVTRMSAPVLLALVAGALWLLLWRGRWRLLGIVPMALALLSVPLARGPDILIDRSAQTFALRDPDGRLAILQLTRSDFTAARWLESDGDDRLPAEARSDLFTCDPAACIAPLATGGRMAIVRHPAALEEECRSARVLVATFDLQRACAGPDHVLDRDALNRRGARALRFKGAAIDMAAAEPEPGTRPWAAQRIAPRRLPPPR